MMTRGAVSCVPRAQIKAPAPMSPTHHAAPGGWGAHRGRCSVVQDGADARLHTSAVRAAQGLSGRKELTHREVSREASRGTPQTGAPQQNSHGTVVHGSQLGQSGHFRDTAVAPGIPKRGGVESSTSRGRRSILSAEPVRPLARLPPLRERRARRERSRTGSGKSPMVRRPAFPEASA